MLNETLSKVELSEVGLFEEQYLLFCYVLAEHSAFRAGSNLRL